MNGVEINFENAVGGFYGYFRKPSKADRIYVQDDRGHRILFGTALEAHQEAVTAFLKDRYGVGIRGESLAYTSAIAEAETFFNLQPLTRENRPPTILRQKGKTRITEVVRRRVGA